MFCDLSMSKNCSSYGTIKYVMRSSRKNIEVSVGESLLRLAKHLEFTRDADGLELMVNLTRDLLLANIRDPEISLVELNEYCDVARQRLLDESTR